MNTMSTHKITREERRQTLEETLPHFHGTERYHKLTVLGDFVATDGVAFLAETGECYWLMDAIACHQGRVQGHHDLRLRDFQLWIVRRVGADAARLECWADTGEGEVAAITQEIPYSDFPLDEIKLYLEGGVLMLPGER